MAIKLIYRNNYFTSNNLKNERKKLINIDLILIDLYIYTQLYTQILIYNYITYL